MRIFCIALAIVCKQMSSVEYLAGHNFFCTANSPETFRVYMTVEGLANGTRNCRLAEIFGAHTHHVKWFIRGPQNGLHTIRVVTFSSSRLDQSYLALLLGDVMWLRISLVCAVAVAIVLIAASSIIDAAGPLTCSTAVLGEKGRDIPCDSRCYTAFESFREFN